MKLFRFISHVVRRSRRETELAREIEHHRALRQEALERAGLSSKDSAVASRRALGNVMLAREDARGVWIWPSFERLWQDLRYGVRMLARQPTFAATAILTLSIGIGATTTVFSVVEFEMWKPLPFPEPDRLVRIYTTGKGMRGQHDRTSAPELLDWRAQSRAFEELAAYRPRTRRVLRGRNVPESVTVMPVTSNYLSMLRRAPVLGRGFGPEDDKAAGRAAILSDAAWRRIFEADPGVIGRGITIDDQPYTVAGVMPDARFEFFEVPDVFTALDLENSHDRRARDLEVVGRLRSDVELPAAGADLQLVAQRLARDYPADNEGRGVKVDDLREAYTGWNWRPLFFFLGAALFVLVLTCVNVAGLVLARALNRGREFAIRCALGGGRTALLRQLVVEGALLTIPAAAIGLLFAIWAVGLLPPWLPEDYLSRGTRIELDARVYLFAFTVAGLTAMLFGLAPALLTTRRDLNPTIAQDARTVVGSRHQRLTRHALVAGEIMMALVMLVGAGLFINSFVRLTRVPLGFEPQDRLTMRIAVTGARYGDRREIVRFGERVLERSRAVPGIRGAALATSVPLDSGPLLHLVVPDRRRPATGEETRAIVRAVTPEYFTTFGIRRVAGRAFATTDTDGAPNIAIINETFASDVFPGENPIGRELLILDASAAWVKKGTVQIVGIVANTKEVGINEVAFNGIYLPFAQHPPSSFQLAVSTTVPSGSVVDSLRQQIFALDRDLPVYSIRTMEQLVDRAFQTDRFNLLLIAAFAVLAMIVAAVGIYGAMSYAVEQRTREFGLRLALGAQRSGILTLALGQATRLGVIGTALGLAASFTISRVLGTSLYLVPKQHNGLIYGVSTTDPLTLTCASLLLVIVSALAGLLPARRATRVDPVVALRCE
jgi:putative ABC transport system permease protein